VFGGIAENRAAEVFREHDLRATFVTLNRYRRQVRQASELGFGPLTSLDVAIPELAQRIALAQAEEARASGVGQDVGQSAGPLIPPREKSS